MTAMREGTVRIWSDDVLSLYKSRIHKASHFFLQYRHNSNWEWSDELRMLGALCSTNPSVRNEVLLNVETAGTRTEVIPGPKILLLPRVAQT